MRCWMRRPGLQSPVRTTFFELQSSKTDTTVQRLTQAQPIGFRPYLHHLTQCTMVQRLLAYLRRKQDRRMGCKCPFHITRPPTIYTNFSKIPHQLTSLSFPSRSIIRPSIQASLEMISRRFALQTAAQAASSNINIGSLLSISPQTLIAPLSYQLVNLIPFDQPV